MLLLVGRNTEHITTKRHMCVFAKCSAYYRRFLDRRKICWPMPLDFSWTWTSRCHYYADRHNFTVFFAESNSIDTVRSASLFHNVGFNEFGQITNWMPPSTLPRAMLDKYAWKRFLLVHFGHLFNDWENVWRPEKLWSLPKHSTNAHRTTYNFSYIINHLNCRIQFGSI